MTARTPQAFAAALEALVADFGQTLTDNEIMTALEAQLIRAWADAGEPQPPGLLAAAPNLLEAGQQALAILEAEFPAQAPGEPETRCMAALRAAIAKAAPDFARRPTDGAPNCRECDEAYPEAGDGWDGLCPTCADRAIGSDDG